MHITVFDESLVVDGLAGKNSSLEFFRNYISKLIILVLKVYEGDKKKSGSYLQW